ncbi:hypothetical protein JR316_0007404 [Psilocybe cubensis]|uniref:Uncharacterized protein n=2 Tax=Psilocybe cubensis TaxID=181762 RepID=A0ACB8GYZ4_PSICU|nr:hypothetical protein JR316_0007404 [Psilocybe cubensis]KAH9480804.1 hypothetical protein JR316_0007404 [Psilocybe cubensis]
MDTSALSIAKNVSRKVGPDGLTKQQRYLEKKILKQEEAEIQKALSIDDTMNQLLEPLVPNPSPSFEALAQQPRQAEVLKMFTERSTQTDNQIEKSIETNNNIESKDKSYYTSQEYYLSQEFEDLMHEKLMTLERLDRAKKADKAYEKVIDEYDDFYQALKQRWTIHSGWSHSRRFKGSRLEEKCRLLQDALQEADELNSNVLQETPPNTPEWFETFVQLREIVGKRGHLQVVYHTLMDTV